MTLFFFGTMSCSKQEQTSQGNEIDYTKPILLSQMLQAELEDVDADTKSAALISSMAGQEFAVLAYKYDMAGIGGSDGTWLTNRAQAKVNVFAGTTGGTDYNVPQVVECSDGGVCTYDAIQYWNKKMNYTFFAYYPKTIAVKTEDGSNYTSDTMGAPFIEYSVLSAPGTLKTFSEMQDVMTAYSIDRNVRDGREVNLNFQHRLFCIAVKALNMEEEPVTISSLMLTLDGIQNQSVRLALDRSLADKVTAFNPKSTGSFPVISTAAEAYTVPKNEKHTVSGDNNILLIAPQAAGIATENGSEISVSYKIGSGAEQSRTSKIRGIGSIDFEAGRKYYATMTFSQGGVFVEIKPSPRWIDEFIDIEFE